MKTKVATTERKARARKIIARLKREYPDATCALHHSNALELVVATILSAQCTDARVNMVTPHLFAKYRTAADYASADPRVLEKEIQSTASSGTRPSRSSAWPRRSSSGTAARCPRQWKS